MRKLKISPSEHERAIVKLVMEDLVVEAIDTFHYGATTIAMAKLAKHLGCDCNKVIEKIDDDIISIEFGLVYPYQTTADYTMTGQSWRKREYVLS